MTAWLMMLKEKRKRVSEGYDDNASTHYSWDSSVGNHAKVRPGDVIVLWDSEVLLGLSVIEDIIQGEGVKKSPYCPYCGKANVAERTKKTPRFACESSPCKQTFDEEFWKTKEVRTYRSNHERGWTSAHAHLTEEQLRPLCIKPESINSIRELDWAKFKQAWHAAPEPLPLNIINTTQQAIAGGHSVTTTRVRKGQAAFRKSLLNQFGETCAFTGASPSQALEAAHLYSYASSGEHHTHGGLLIRRDLHSLFDVGLIAVNPKSKKLDVSEDLKKYPEYWKLHGSWLSVDLAPKHLKWLGKHWDMHRGPEGQPPPSK